MKPAIQTLGQILYSPSQYVIPVFQRNYRWEAAQWAKLWDSLNEIQRPEKRGNHFMGFLVFVPGLAQPGEHTTSISLTANSGFPVRPFSLPRAQYRPTSSAAGIGRGDPPRLPGAPEEERWSALPLVT
jgi:hypothetical protein